MVAYVPSTSRVSPRSAYYTGTSNKGGTREDAKKMLKNKRRKRSG